MKQFRLPAVFPSINYRTVLFAAVLILLVAQTAVAPALATSVREIPLPSAAEPLWIVDEGDVLSRITESTLTQTFKKLAQQTGYQVRFVTIHRLDYGETVETFARQLLERWFPDAESRANQAVLVLDTVTNGASLQAGAIAQSLLPADLTQSVIGETLAIPLRQNKYNQALQDTGDRLVAVLSGKPDPGPPEVKEIINVEGTFAKAEETDTNRVSATVWVIGLLVAATVIPMATYYFYVFLQSRA